MNKKFNIFFLPFAGGNKYSYKKYVEMAPHFLNIIPLEYPGRGTRIGESLMTDMTLLIDDLYGQVRGRLDSGNFAIYGHSLGGLAAYLLTRKLIDNNHPRPVHLFVTGTSGPAAPSREDKKTHLLGKAEFVEEVRQLDGSPEEILDNEELLDYFEPILRADFALSENYVYRQRLPIDIPLTVITGTEEGMTEADIQLWQKETTCRVDFRRMPGKHFFILKYPDRVLEIIAKKVLIYSKTYQL